MPTLPCQPRCDESLGFPSTLRASVRAAVALVAQGETAPPHGVFTVNVDGEALQIPSRLYYDADRLRRAIDNAHGVDRLVLATLARRVTSYWNCYYRRAYPDRAGYPGTRVLALMRPDATAR